MAKSKFEYVKSFEAFDKLLNNTFIVIRIDGHSFHKFSAAHQFEKPNDLRSIHLMTASAQAVMEEFDQIVLAYGQSDEFSFVFKRTASLYQRREAKLITNICSLFTSYFVMHWNEFFPNVALKYPPSFDGRAVCYPSFQNLRDYLSWRQADCHINNLYNTCFWSLVLDSNSPRTERQAHELLKGTDSGQKNELLFSTYNINYAKTLEIFRKGTLLVREKIKVETEKSTRIRSKLFIYHRDIIGEEFWNEKSEILEELSSEK